MKGSQQYTLTKKFRSTSGEYLRGRIVDPTGAFNVYAGHYQPEALVALSNLTKPCFVAVVGKTNAIDLMRKPRSYLSDLKPS